MNHPETRSDHSTHSEQAPHATARPSVGRTVRQLLRRPATSAIAMLGLPGFALAGPEGGDVVRGAADINRPDDFTTTIDQFTDRAVINWDSFNVGADEFVIFNQLDSSSIVLNRVLGGDASYILGQIEANGQVFLLNPQGVYFGEGASIDVQGFLASTLDMSNDDFMAGEFTLSRTLDANSTGEVVNDGNITAGEGGYVLLAGDFTENTGVVTAMAGTVALVSGSELTLDIEGDGLVNFSVDAATLAEASGVRNAGSLIADGGMVVMTARVANDLVATAVNNEGLVRARSIENKGGEIWLVGHGGDVEQSGTLDASGENGDGGQMMVRSNADVLLADGGVQAVDGDAGFDAGDARFIGEETLTQESGNVISAQGETGGQVEVSGYGGMTVGGTQNIGAGGNFILDPEWIALDSFTSTPAYTASSFAWSPFAPSNYANSESVTLIGIPFITTQLNSNVDVTLVAQEGYALNGSLAGFNLNASGTGDLGIYIGDVATGGSTSFGQGLAGGVFGGSGVTVNPSTDTDPSHSISLSSFINQISIAGNFTASIAGGGTDATISLPDITANNVTINAGSGTVALSGAVNGASGSVQANGDVTITGSTIQNVYVNRANNVVFNGDYSGSYFTAGSSGTSLGASSGNIGTFTVNGNVNATNWAWVQVAPSGSINITGAMNIGSVATLAAGINQASPSGSVTLNGLDAVGNITLHGGTLNLSGQFLTSGSIAVNGNGSIVGTGFSFGNSTNAVAGVSITGSINNTGNVEMWADDISNAQINITGGIITTGSLVLNAQGSSGANPGVTVGGAISAGGSVNFTALASFSGGSISATGGIVAGNGIFMDAQGSGIFDVNITLGSVTATSGNIDIAASNTGSYGGEVNIGGPLTASNGSISLSGTGNFGGGRVITNNINISGGALNITATGGSDGTGSAAGLAQVGNITGAGGSLENVNISASNNGGTSGGRVVIGGASNVNDVTLSATNTNNNAVIDINGVVAGNGNFLANATAGGVGIVNLTGATGGIDAGGNVSFGTGVGFINAGTGSYAISAGNNIDYTGQFNTNGTNINYNAGGNITVSASEIFMGNIVAGGQVNLTGSGATNQSIGNVTANHINLQFTPSGSGSIVATLGSLTATGTASGSRDVVVNVNGGGGNSTATVNLAGASATNGGVAIKLFDGAIGSPVGTLNVTNNIDSALLTDLYAPGDITIGGGISGGNVNITTLPPGFNGGNVTLSGGGSASGSFNITANGGSSFGGVISIGAPLTATGNISLTAIGNGNIGGGEINVNGGGLVLDAGGNLTINATANTTGSDSPGAVITISGDISAASDISLTASNAGSGFRGGQVNVGGVNAGGLVTISGAGTGNSAGIVDINGPVSGSSVGITAAGGLIDIGTGARESSYAAGDVNATSGNINLTLSGNNIGGGGIIVAGDLVATGGAVTINASTGQGHVHLGDYSGGALTTPGNITADSSITINANGSVGAVDAGSLSGLGPINITTQNISLNDVFTTSGNISLTASGSGLNQGNVTVANNIETQFGAVLVTGVHHTASTGSGGNVNIGGVVTAFSGNASINASDALGSGSGGSLVIGGITATGTTTLNANDGGAGTGGNILVTSSGVHGDGGITINAGNVGSSANVEVNGTILTPNTVTINASGGIVGNELLIDTSAGGAGNVTINGNVQLDSAATGDVVIWATNNGNVDINGSVNARSGIVDINAGGATSGGLVTVDGPVNGDGGVNIEANGPAGNIEIGTSTSGFFTGGTVTATSGAITMSAAGGNFGGHIYAGALNAGLNLDLLTSGSNGSTAANIRLGNADSTGALTSAANATAGGTISVTTTAATIGGNIEAGTLSAGGDLLLNMQNTSLIDLSTLTFVVANDFSLVGNSASTYNLPNVTAQNILIDVTPAASGTVSLNTGNLTANGTAGTSVGNVNVSIAAGAASSGNMTIGTISAVNDAALNIGASPSAALNGNISAGTVNFGGNFAAIAPGAANITGLGTTGASLNIDVGSSINVGSGITVTGAADLRASGGAGSIDVAGNISASSANIEAFGSGGRVEIGTSTSGFFTGGNITATAGLVNIDAFSSTEGGGHVYAGAVNAAGDLIIKANGQSGADTGIIRLGNADSTGALTTAAAATAGGSAFIDVIAASTGGTIAASGISAGSNITINNNVLGFMDASGVNLTAGGIINISGNATQSFGSMNADGIRVFTSIGDILTGSLTASNSTGPAFVELETQDASSGTINVGGGITVNGTATSNNPIAAHVNLLAPAFIGTGSVNVAGPINVTGAAANYSIAQGSGSETGFVGETNVRIETGSNGVVALGDINLNGVARASIDIVGTQISVGNVTANIASGNFTQAFTTSCGGTCSLSNTQTMTSGGFFEMSLRDLGTSAGLSATIGNITATAPDIRLDVGAFQTITGGSINATATGLNFSASSTGTMGGSPVSFSQTVTNGGGAAAFFQASSAASFGAITLDGAGSASLEIEGNTITTGALSLAASGATFTVSGERAFGSGGFDDGETPGPRIDEGTIQGAMVRAELRGYSGTTGTGSVAASQVDVLGSISAIAGGMASVNVLANNINVSGNITASATANVIKNGIIDDSYTDSVSGDSFQESGTVASSLGTANVDLEGSSLGSVTAGNITANGASAGVGATGGTVTIGNINVSATGGSLDVTSTTTNLTAGTSESIDFQGPTFINGTRIKASGTVTIGSLNVSGVGAGGALLEGSSVSMQGVNINFTDASYVVQDSAAFGAGTNSFTLGDAMFDVAAPTATINGNVTISGAQMAHVGGNINATGTVSITGPQGVTPTIQQEINYLESLGNDGSGSSILLSGPMTANATSASISAASGSLDLVGNTITTVGDLTLTAGSPLDLGTATLNVGGNLIVNGPSLFLGGGTTASYNLVTNVGGLSLGTVGNVTIDNTANTGTMTLSQSGTASNITISDGGTIALSTALTASNSINLTASGGLTGVGTISAAAINLTAPTISGDSIALSGGTLAISASTVSATTAISADFTGTASFGAAGLVAPSLTLNGGGATGYTLTTDINALNIGSVASVTITNASNTGTLAINQTGTVGSLDVSHGGAIDITSNISADNIALFADSMTWGTNTLTATTNMDLFIDNAMSGTGMLTAGSLYVENIGASGVDLVTNTGDLFLAVAGPVTIDNSAFTGVTSLGFGALQTPVKNGTANAQMVTDATFTLGGDALFTTALNVASLTINGVGVDLNGQTVSVSGTMDLNLSSALNLNGGTLNTGTLLASASSITDGGIASTLDAGAMDLQASGTIDLSSTTTTIGSSSLAGVSGDTQLLGLLGDEGVAPSASGPNANLSGTVVSLGTVTMSGSYLYIESSDFSIGSFTGTDPNTLVQLASLDPAASIGVEDQPATTATVNYSNADVLSAFAGYSIAVGTTSATGDITIGQNGELDIGNTNFFALSTGTVKGIENVISTGIVKDLDSLLGVGFETPQTDEIDASQDTASELAEDYSTDGGDVEEEEEGDEEGEDTDDDTSIEEEDDSLIRQDTIDEELTCS